jgi:hypothetical protein
MNYFALINMNNMKYDNYSIIAYDIIEFIRNIIDTNKIIIPIQITITLNERI